MASNQVIQHVEFGNRRAFSFWVSGDRIFGVSYGHLAGIYQEGTSLIEMLSCCEFFRTSRIVTWYKFAYNVMPRL